MTEVSRGHQRWVLPNLGINHEMKSSLSSPAAAQPWCTGVPTARQDHDTTSYCIVLEQDPNHTVLHQCSGHHVRFGNIPHGLTAQAAQHPSTEPSTTSNISYCHKQLLEHLQHQSLEQTGEQTGERQPALQQAPPVGVSRAEEVQNRIQDSPSGWKHSLQHSALCRGEREGRVSWSVASTAVYGGYAFPRVCFNREHETHNFIVHFPSPPTGNFSYFLVKNPPQNNQQLTKLGGFQTGSPP